MSYDGSLSNKPGKVSIPLIDSMGQMLTPGLANGSLRFSWFTNDRVYYGGDGGATYYSYIDDPVNCYGNRSSNNLSFGYIYPYPIDGYFYAFCAASAGTLTDSVVYRAPLNEPEAFTPYGTLAVQNATSQVYVDSTYIYLFGGGSSTAIQRAPRSAPTTFTNVGSMPAAASNKFGLLVAAGTNLYIYGGDAALLTSSSAIYTATMANPLVWSNTGASIPKAIYGGAAYNDGSYVYILGATATSDLSVNNCYRASVSSPTSLTAFGSCAHGDYQYLYLRGSTYYALTRSSVATGVEYSTSAMTFSDVTNVLYATQYGGGAGIVHNGNIYLLGGKTSTNSSASYLSNVQIASTTSPTTLKLAGSLPTGLARGQVVKTSTKAYLIGAEPTTGTFGSYYEAPLSNLSTGWALTATTGPSTFNGKCLFYKNKLFYFGGETLANNVSTTVSSNVYVATVQNGSLSSWSAVSGTGFPSLSRFSLVVAGEYVYVIGGWTGSAATSNVYRNKINDLMKSSSWSTILLGGVAACDRITVISNNRVFLLGGSSTTGTTGNSNSIISFSMSDLANGVISSSGHNATLPDNLSEGNCFFANDTAYIYGSRVNTANSNALYKNHSFSRYYSVGANSISNSAPQIVVDDNGTFGTISGHQRTGNLPWLVTTY